MSTRVEQVHQGVAGLIPDPSIEPTVSVERTAKLFGISRASAYEAVRRGEIPSLRFNRRVVVPTALLLKMLGQDASAPLDGDAA